MSKLEDLSDDELMSLLRHKEIEQAKHNNMQMALKIL